MNAKLLTMVSDPAAIQADPFAVLQELTSAVNVATTDGFEDVNVQKMVLYALENRSSFGAFGSVLDGLLIARGLFPYLESKNLSASEEFLSAAHRPEGLDGFVFHQEQSEVYLRLMGGENVILSAPTSFGKSLIVDALIASRKYSNIAVVVPTIALIDETRRRLCKQFGEAFKVVTHASQQLETKNIFVLTQERVLDFDGFPNLDLFVIDEFYKLDPRRDSDRSLLLNQAFYKLLKTGAQFYMLGPNIERIPDSFSQAIRSTFISTPYSTVVTEHIDVPSSKSDSLKKLVELCATLLEPTLIYCASPASARRVALALMGASEKSDIQELRDSSEWISDNYHPDWVVARAMAQGIGVHHGKVPRALGQYAVRSFNSGFLRFLVCTSTLIEGVNTKAKNVVIYDNRVALKKLDFFTFNNIRGRSGRMFEHYVGRVFLFNSAPQGDLPFVDIPLVTQGEGTPESLLIHIDDIDLTDASRDRMSALHDQSVLSLEVIKKNSGIDPRLQIRLAERLRSNSEYYPLLSWTGFPDYDQLRFVCELMWEYFVGEKRVGGVFSGKQLAFRIDRLRKARSVRSLILKELSSQESPDADAAVEDVLDFVRTWASFHFPRYLMAIDRIQREIYLPWMGGAGDYSAYAANVENLFSSSGLVALDEYGVPIQIAEKIAPRLGNHESVDGAVEGLRALRIETLFGLSEFEKRLLFDAKSGLGKGRSPRIAPWQES